MFARLYTNSGDVKTAYSELSKVITGVITSPASLTAFNSSTSTIDATQPSNWVEYTSVGSTNSVNAGTAIWFRQRNRAGRWKYACVYRTTSPTNTHKGLLRHYTTESPSVVASVAGVATNNSEAYGATTEYTVAAGPGYLIVATRLTTAAHFTEAHMWLEYPETGNSAFLTLPNHVLYRHYTTGGSYATDATTDIAYSTGIVEVAKSGNTDVAVYNGGMSTPATMHGTMKPSYFTSLGNTLSGSSTFVDYPFVNLFYVSQYQGHLDCSALTNVWGTGPTLAVPNPAAPSGMSLLTCATNAIEDLSTNSFTVTAVGNTVVTSSSPFASGYSNYFDGSGDYLSFPNDAAFNFGSGNFTIEFWFKRTGTNQTYARYFQTANGDVATGISIAQNLNTQNQIRVSMSTSGTSWDIFDNLAGTLSDLQWNHCALVRNGNNFTFYVNGVGTLIVTSSASLHYNAANTCIIGGQTGRSTSGYISNLRIVKGTAIYTSNFTPATSSLPSGVSSNPTYGDTITINGSNYAFLKANGSLSYLVPKR